MPASPNPEAEEVYGKEEAHAKILLNLLKTEHTKLLSDIEHDDIPILTGVGIISDIIDSDIIRDAREEWLQFQVSRGRAGRQEMVTVALASRYQGGGGGSSGGGLKSLLAGIK